MPNVTGSGQPCSTHGEEVCCPQLSRTFFPLAVTGQGVLKEARHGEQVAKKLWPGRPIGGKRGEEP